MTTLPLLSITIFIPLIGALLIVFNKASNDQNARWVALWTSLVTFILSLVLWGNFDPTSSGFQLVDKCDWMPLLNIGYQVGVDGISMPFVLLSTFLVPLCILASWNSVSKNI